MKLERICKLVTAACLPVIAVVAYSIPAHAGDKPFPYKVSADPAPSGTGYGFDVMKFSITPLDDYVVSDIQLNRGNCHLYEPKVTNRRPVAISYPIPFKFGLRIEFWTEPNCDMRVLVVKTTSGGEYTMNFVD